MGCSGAIDNPATGTAIEKEVLLPRDVSHAQQWTEIFTERELRKQ